MSAHAIQRQIAGPGTAPAPTSMSGTGNEHPFIFTDRQGVTGTKMSVESINLFDHESVSEVYLNLIWTPIGPLT